MEIERKKKRSNPTAIKVATFEQSDAVAIVWLREANGGVTYLDFTLQRCYQSKQKRCVCSSDRFFARNKQSLHELIDQATDFVERHQAFPERALEAVRKQRNPRDARASKDRIHVAESPKANSA